MAAMTRDNAADAKQKLADSSTTELRFFADVRYVGQSYELTIPISGDGHETASRLKETFACEYERVYGYANRNPMEMVSLRLPWCAVTTSPLPTRLRAVRCPKPPRRAGSGSPARANLCAPRF